MKPVQIIFGCVVAFMALMLFGSLGLSRLIRWLGWPQDVLFFAGVVLILVTGMCLIAWRIGIYENTFIKP